MAVDPLIAHIISFWLAIYLGASAVGKLRDTSGFSQAVAAYRLMPTRMVVLVASVIPFLEILVAAAWLVPATRPLAAWASALLLAVFATAIAINLMRGRSHIDCGCNAGHKQRISWWLVFRNLVLAAVGLCVLLPVTARSLSFLDLLLIVMITGFSYLFSVLVPMIINNSTDLKKGVQQ